MSDLSEAAEGKGEGRPFGVSNAFARRVDFADSRYEVRRLFAEVFGTFLLVAVAFGAEVVNVRFGGGAVSASARAIAPGVTVGVVILFMGAVSGAHLNPVVSVAFALRRDFPWRRVPGYVAAQMAGAMLAALVITALLGRHGAAGLSAPGPGVTAATAMWWEALLTVGLVSTILGASSGAQAVGPLAALAVGGYISVAGLWGAKVSGASMNPARSLGPATVVGLWSSWWPYLAGPVLGSLVAVGFAWILRGPGGGPSGKSAAQGKPTG